MAGALAGAVPARDWRVPSTALVLSCFALLAWSAMSGYALAYDEALMWRVHALAHPVLDQAAWWLARLGYGYGVLPFNVLLVLVLAVRGRSRHATFALSALGGSALLNTALKHTFARARPSLWPPAEVQHTFSFPSGHAMAVGTLAVVVMALAWRTRWRWPVLLMSAAFALMVGASRCYVGVHYPVDVLAGWCAGVAWAIAMHRLVLHDA